MHVPGNVFHSKNRLGYQCVRHAVSISFKIALLVGIVVAENDDTSIEIDMQVANKISVRTCLTVSAKSWLHAIMYKNLENCLKIYDVCILSLKDC